MDLPACQRPVLFRPASPWLGRDRPAEWHFSHLQSTAAAKVRIPIFAGDAPEPEVLSMPYSLAADNRAAHSGGHGLGRVTKPALIAGLNAGFTGGAGGLPATLPAGASGSVRAAGSILYERAIGCCLQYLMGTWF